LWPVFVEIGWSERFWESLSYHSCRALSWPTNMLNSQLLFTQNLFVLLEAPYHLLTLISFQWRKRCYYELSRFASVLPPQASLSPSVSFFWITWGFFILFFPSSGFRNSFNSYSLFLNDKLDLTKSNMDLYLIRFSEQYKDLRLFNSCHPALLPYPLLFSRLLYLPCVYTSQI